mgnify:CR=1 FL=1
MTEEMLRKVILPIASGVWLIALFFLGWKTILWTCIGIAIGLIVKQLKENV